jgi:DNA mismatch endonuclease (patch repair protein)
MSSIKSKNTSIELILRKALWEQNIRYRKNYKELPGSPDIAITKYKIAIFCDSEFFHGYNWEEKKKKLENNRDYWIKKIEKNMERDRKVDKELEDMGWIVLRFWGCDIKKRLDGCVKMIQDAIIEVIINYPKNI